MSPPVVREATRVERLAYTRRQAAEPLGISASTFNRRVLPFIETLEMDWGTRLVPVDELERFAWIDRKPSPRGASAGFWRARMSASPPPEAL